MTARFWCAACAVASVGLVATLNPSAHTKQTQVTWSSDIANILAARCVACHEDGGFGAMPLATYEDARTWAKAIRREVLERRMPPWSARREFGEFANARSLTPLEIDLIAAWVDGGTPVGAVVPKRIDRREGKTEKQRSGLSRSVTLIVPPHDVTATLARFELRTRFENERWVDAFQFEPGNRRLVEEAIISLPDGTVIGSWTPPEDLIRYIPGVAQKLGRDSTVSLEIRYRKSIEPTSDSSRLTLYFTDRPRREVRHRTLACGETTLDEAVDLLAVKPIAEKAGDQIEVIGYRPDGRVEPFVVIEHFQPEYRTTYRFRRALRLTSRSKILIQSTSDQCFANVDFVSP